MEKIVFHKTNPWCQKVGDHRPKGFSKAVFRLPKSNIQCQKPRSDAYNTLRSGEIAPSVTDTVEYSSSMNTETSILQWEITKEM